MIRRLLPHEVSSITSLGKAMVEEIGGIPGGFNAGVFESNWRALLSSGQGLILVNEEAGSITGGVGGSLSSDVNSGLVAFSELFFYVDKDKRGIGLKLLIRLDKELRQIGVKISYMASLCSDDKQEGVDKLYERLGYKPHNHTMIKDYTNAD